MYWLLFAIFAWLLFILLVDFSRLKRTVFGGLIAVVFQLFTDINFTNLGLYEINNQFIEFFNTSLLFTIGPVFTMGVLFVQFLPSQSQKWLQIINIFVWAVLFFLEELALMAAGSLGYNNWNSLSSLFINMLVFIALTWLAQLFDLSKTTKRERN